MKIGKVNFTKAELTSIERIISLGEKIFPLLPPDGTCEKDVVAIKTREDREPWFLIFAKTPGNTPVLRYLKGWKELSKIMEYSSQARPPVPGWLLEMNMLELHFIQAEAAFPGEMELLEKLGRPAGKNRPFRPLTRSVRPGMAPWMPDAEERATLEKLLYQTLGILLRLEDDDELLSRNLPYGIFYRAEDKRGNWCDKTLERPQLPKPGFAFIINDDIRAEFARLPMTDAKLEMDFRFLPLHVEGIGEREALQYVLMAVNVEKKSIASCTPISGIDGIPKLWSTLPAILLKMLKDIGGCPAEIHVCTERLLAFLRPFCMDRPFKLVYHDHLENINHATAMLVANIEGGKGKPQTARTGKPGAKDEKNDRSGN